MQAFLIQALIERVAPGGDPSGRGIVRCRRIARRLANYRYYPWQSGEMDGYADTIESAIYIMHEVDDPAGPLG